VQFTKFPYILKAHMPQITTATREAFLRLNGSVINTPVGKMIAKAALSGAGVRIDKKGWNANLSFRTYNKLKADGYVN